MKTRREFIFTAAITGTALALPACSVMGGESDYDQAVKAIWHKTDVSADTLHELVRYATLAPSSHNTQCWKFKLAKDSISILPDLSRRCPAVDPDDHHLFVSLGCAAENLLQATSAKGLHGDGLFATDASNVLTIALSRTKAVPSPLFDAITKRQSTRAEYDGKALSNAELKLLEQAGTGNGVELIVLTEKPAMENVLDYVIQGNTAQMNDPAFMKELKQWIRFGESEAVSAGDGLFSRSSGSPALPRWLGSRLFDQVFTVKAETEKYAKHIRSSAGIAIFVSDQSDKTHWLEVGRAFERFALQAAALGIRNAHLNQPVEVSTLRPQFAAFLGIGNRRPDLVIRFGRGPEMPRSLRRPIESVLA